jgi:hypothetical protein
MKEREDTSVARRVKKGERETKDRLDRGLQDGMMSIEGHGSTDKKRLPLLPHRLRQRLIATPHEASLPLHRTPSRHQPDRTNPFFLGHHEFGCERRVKSWAVVYLLSSAYEAGFVLGEIEAEREGLLRLVVGLLQSNDVIGGEGGHPGLGRAGGWKGRAVGEEGNGGERGRVRRVFVGKDEVGDRIPTLHGGGEVPVMAGDERLGREGLEAEGGSSGRRKVLLDAGRVGVA